MLTTTKNTLANNGQTMWSTLSGYLQILADKKEGKSIVFENDNYSPFGVVVGLEAGTAKVLYLAGALVGSNVIIGDRQHRGVVIYTKKNCLCDVTLHTDTFVINLGDKVFISSKNDSSFLSVGIQIPISPLLRGRLLNAYGEPMDTGEKLPAIKKFSVEKNAPGFIFRSLINEAMETGILAIDNLLPLGLGQRQLIIGDRKTGKTSVVLDTIIHNKYNVGLFYQHKDREGTNDPANTTLKKKVGAKNIVFVYVSIAQSRSEVNNIYHVLAKKKALYSTIMVAVSACEPAALQVLAPYVGCAIGEWFRNRGRNACVVYDDLSKHANAYRQLSLLLRRPPGREAYPADIFYLHAKLLERAAKLCSAAGSGALTALPIVETQNNDIAAYIPTNIISITDGQIYLDRELFSSGVRPAINLKLSVSRVGSKAQTNYLKKLSWDLRIQLAQYRSVENLLAFNANLDKKTTSKIVRGSRLLQLITQPLYAPMSLNVQILFVHAGTKGYLDFLTLNQVTAWKTFVLYKFSPLHYFNVLDLSSVNDIKSEFIDVIVIRSIAWIKKNSWIK